MNLGNMFRKVVHYLTEAFAEVFSPNHDDYPEGGTQPFDAEPYETPKKKS